MYMYFVYAHKASWHSAEYSPNLRRKLMVYQVRIKKNLTVASRSVWNSYIVYSGPRVE